MNLYRKSRPLLWSSDQCSWQHNGDIFCFLWGTTWIYVCYVEGSRPPLLSSDQSSCRDNGDVLWFLWSTNSIYICYVEEIRPPLSSSDQNSWLQTQRSRLNYRRYQIFWEVVGLEWGSLSLVSAIGSDLEIPEYIRRDPSCWQRDTLYPKS
jgi:hypothetical protein